MIGIFLTGAYFYIKYQVPVYQVTARVVVNDGEQEKGANLFQALTYKNVDRETEREKEILKSKSLIFQVVQNEQLNIRWLKKGRVTIIPQFGNLPLEVWLENPDSVKKTITGDVKLLSAKSVSFDGVIYPIDSLVHSVFGNLRWHLNSADQFTNEWELTLMPVKKAAAIFRSQLNAEPISKQSAILDLTLQETIPGRGVLFLTSLLEQYGQNNVAFKNRVYQNTAKFVEERLRLVSDELNGVESKLENFKTKEGIYNLSSQGDLYLNQLKDIDQKMGETELQLVVLKKIEQYVNNRNHTPEAVPATLGLTDPILLSLLNQLYSAEFEAEKLRKLSGSKNPELEVLDESIFKLKPSILASIQNLRISLQSSKDKLTEQEKQFMGELKGIPQKERALLEISRQQQIKNNIYTFLLQKREEAVLSAASQTPNHRVINAPESVGQVAPKSNMIYAVALSLACILFILFSYFKEFINDKVLFSSDLIQETSLPLLGELVFSHRSETDSVIKGDERILIAEQIRDLRTNLSYIQIQKQGAQVLLITSSISGEGKSFITINLAAALGRVDKKVLMIESDLRKPGVTKKMNIPRGKGLTDYLIGQATLEEIVRPVERLSNVSLISAGQIPPNPVELLLNGRLNSLMEILKTQFDYILIDSPPAGVLTDAKVLAAYADNTLYIVRHNYTPHEFIHFIRDQANLQTLPRIHLIFNGVVRKKVFGYGYGYGYEYGYGYVKEDEVKRRSIFKRKRDKT
ncbi:polysaccharide biosynthesis tyrosine autokinase [Ferruginibacter sp.]|uniref:GumC family protein n=1 Tax=Ferruginibacter sp. TaxID=1940288 RepID=UPI00265A3808|nr:polysaccharide biosynthesis tyrosine autokinase [Ferruginibacter sp.]